MDNIIKFPNSKTQNNIIPAKSKGFHEKKIKTLLHELTYEITRGFQEGEFDEQIKYRVMLPQIKESNLELILSVLPTWH